MQYKQCERVLAEILRDPQIKTKTVFAIARLLAKPARRFPKLGPYRKRSLQQVLWRLASDSTRGANERWFALCNLLSNASQKPDLTGIAELPDRREAPPAFRRTESSTEL